jgi:thioredoxin 1
MSELNKVLRKNTLVVVDFHASWCNPCKILAPKLEILCKENNIILYKIDVDEFPDIASKFEIKSLPTILFFKDGEKIPNLKIVGAKLDKIKETILKMK